MEKLSLLLQENENWVIERVLYYSKQHNYYKFVTGLSQPWRIAIEGLNSLLISSWAEDNPESVELGLTEELENCTVYKFINTVALKHRSRGVSPGMFLGMVKYFRRSYLDLVTSAGFDRKYKRLCIYFIARFFDRIDICISSTWSENSNELLKELQQSNREIASEKIKYITIFESLPTPAILLNDSNQIESVNHSFTQTFPSPEKVCNWLEGELNAFKFDQVLHKRFEKPLVTKETTKYFEIQMKRMLDLKAKQTGTVIILNDITARIQSQQVLKENEELFRSYFENAAVGTALVAIDGQYLRVNKSLCDMLGFTKEELLASSFKAITHPEDISKSLGFLHNLTSGNNKSCHFEKRYIHKFGYLVWTQLSISLVRDFENQPDYFVLQIKDVTKQKRAELALKESLEKYVTLFNNANDMIALRELKEDGMPGRFIEVNDMACKKLGYTREELLEMTATDLMTAKSVTLLKNRAHEYLDCRTITCELTYKTKTGAEIPFEFSSHIFYKDDKKLALAIARDISERKKAEVEREKALKIIKKSEALLSTYFSNASIGMDLITPDGRFIKVNKALCRILEYSEAELLTKNISDIIHPEDVGVDLHLLEDMIAGKSKSFCVEKRIRTKGGSTLWIQLNTSVIRDENNNILYFADQIQNITEKKWAEDALRTSEEKFRAVFDQASEGIILREITEQGLPGSLVEVNEYACKFTGYSKDELMELGIDLLFNGESLHKKSQILAELPRERRVKFDINIKTKPGALIPVAVVSQLIAINKKSYVLSTARDISQRKKMENLIRENAELYRSYFENSAIGTAFVSVEGAYLKVNKVLCNILGYSADELLNTNLIGYTHPEDVDSSLKFIQTVLNGEKDSFMHEKRYIHKDGDIVWVQIISSLIKDISGKPLYFAAQAVDITERKLADIAFRESREKFRKLFNNSNDMLFLREMETGLPKSIIDVSDLATSKLGYTKDELLKMSVEDLMTENSLEKYSSLKKENFKGGHTSLELDCIAKDKNIFPIEVTIILQMEDVAGSLAIVRDISLRKKTEAIIRESEELYRSYFEDSAIGMAFVGLDGRYKLVNEAMCELSGYSKQELYQMGIKDIAHPEDYPRDLVAIENLLSGKIKNSHLEKRYYHKKGHIVWVKASATLAYDNAGAPTHFIVQIRDITDRKIAEEALKLSEERFITLFDNASDVIVIHKVKEAGMPGPIIEVNKRACLQLGYSKEDFYPLTEKDLLTKKSIETLHSVFKKEPQATCFNAELDVLTKSGSKIPFEINYHLFEFQGQKLIFAICRDISERKKLEEEYIRSSKLNSLAVLAGGIAHDFKNFLTIILGNVSLGKFQFKEQNGVLIRLQEIEKAAQEANKITTQLLSFAKGGELIKETFDFGSVLKDTAFLSLSGSVSTCEVNVPDNLWRVEADKGQIVQVLNNLVLNADQSMPKGGTIKVTAENHIIDTENHKLKEGPYIKLMIEDEGFGIEPEHLSKVFEPYYTTKEKGHGLGLATCYSIIKKHGGHIEVQSEAGLGTMFTIYLPTSITDLEKMGKKIGIIENEDKKQTVSYEVETTAKYF